MPELENQTQTTIDAEPTPVIPTVQTPVTTVTKPSLEEVLSLLAEAGNEGLMQLAPIKDLIQSARKQEKDKLYKSIEQKEAEAKEVQAKLLEAQESLKQYQTENLSFEEKMNLELAKVKADHEALVLGLQAEKEEAQREAQKQSLEAYKARKLREAGDDLILELVGGNSEEEINQSIEFAKAKFQEIASKFASNVAAQKAQDVRDTFTATAPSSSNLQPLTKEEINRMSPEEYAKNRPRIMQLIQSGQIQ